MLDVIQVNVHLKKPGAKVEHHGIKIEFIGQIGESAQCSDTIVSASLND